jgi:hypothetical protein
LTACLHSDDAVRAEKRNNRFDELAPTQAVDLARVYGWHQLVIEDIGVDVEP